jgi:hypothetical protein
MPFESIRNPAGRAMSAPVGPAPVTANNFCLGIGKQRETVVEFLRLPPINLRRIDADADYTDPARIEIRKPVLKTPQLGVAERSPEPAIKNQHDSF